MAKPEVGHTALGTAVCRLIEQYQPEETRLFNDAVVKDMVGLPIRVMMRFASLRNLTIQQTEAVADGIFGAQVCRTRYIDDVVQQALHEGIGQLVILGAGLDTRAYRLPGIERVKVFEVDLPAVQKNKMKKIQKHLGQLPENVTFIPIDFDTQTLDTVFVETDFDPSRPAVFIWEGVTQYISEEAVHRTLTFVGGCAPGSLLVFTYVLKSVIERRANIPNVDKIMDRLSKDSPWIFGLEPASIKTFLRTYHLDLIEDVGNAYYQEKYLQPLKRELAVTEGERIVQARVIRP